MRWLIVVALIAQDPVVKVEPKVSQGDRLTVSVQSSVDVDILVRDGEGESTKLLSIVRRERFTQEVTGAAGGVAESLRIQCHASTIQKVGTGIPLKETNTDLAGKTFIVARTGSGWKVSATDGHGVPSSAGSLGAWNELMRLLPREGAQQGGTWRVASKDLAGLILLDPVSELAGSLDCACESVADGKVTVSFKGSIDCRGADESNIKVTIASGKAVFDAARARPLSVMISGGLEITKDVVDISKKPGQLEDVKTKVGEIVTRSKKLEVSFVFE